MCLCIQLLVYFYFCVSKFQLPSRFNYAWVHKSVCINICLYIYMYLPITRDGEREGEFNVFLLIIVFQQGSGSTLFVLLAASGRQCASCTKQASRRLLVSSSLQLITTGRRLSTF